MIKVGVLGARGRMGAEVCRAVAGAADMELVAGLGKEEDRAVLTDVACCSVSEESGTCPA